MKEQIITFERHKYEIRHYPKKVLETEITHVTATASESLPSTLVS